MEVKASVCAFAAGAGISTVIWLHDSLPHPVVGGVRVVSTAALLLCVDQARRRRALFKEVHLPAVFLGSVFGAGIAVAARLPKYYHFGLYMVSLSAFHFSEYVTTALFNPHKLSFDSFLLNHSTAYQAAAVASWIEYFARKFFFPNFHLPYICNAGLVLTLTGDLLRKVAMFTARSNFSHQIVTEREEDHKLVTHGVYRISRHPSYLGWFLWSVGTQLLLCNPVCLVGYTVASIHFFRDRVPYEEKHLLDFFHEEYEAYQKRTPILIPFVSGWDVSDYQRQWWRRSD